MREYLSVNREVNAIRQRRSTFSGTFLLVEGRSDKIFYERFIDKTACEIVTVSGKPSSKLRVIALLDTLEQSSFLGVLAIVDADFDRLETSLRSNPNLFRTDTHDIETMLMNSLALDKVITEYCSEEKIFSFGRDVRTALLKAGMSVGYLLWYSQRNKLNLTFEGISFSKFIDKQTLQVDEFRLIQEVKNKSQAFSLKSEDMQQWLIEQKRNSHDPWQVCCGHHLIEILSLSLCKAIGSNKKADVEAICLQRNLRLAYETAYFCKTQLHLDICLWESNNRPFKVLQSNQ